MLDKKINLLFLINDRFINNFESVYHEVKNNKKFNIVVVACESKATTYKEFILSEEIHKYLLKRKIKNIDGYDKKKEKYIDLKEFNPDYIFVSNPYDIYRPKEYNSRDLSMIAKVCSIEYGAILLKESHNEIEKNNFFINCYKYFVCAEEEKDLNVAKRILEKFTPIGCIKLDRFLFPKKKLKDNWIKLFKKKTDKLRIVWKPRWTLDRVDKFFSYLEFFSNYIRKNNNVELLLLEHPLLLANLKSKNFYNSYINYIKRMSKLNNFRRYSNDDFLDIILYSDVIISEQSSLMVEFSITNNNIIVIKNDCELNKLGELLADYQIENPEELLSIFPNINNKKEHIFENKRLFKPSNNMSSAKYLLDFIEQDYKNTNFNNDYYKNKLLSLYKEITKINKILTQGYYDDCLLNDTEIPLEDISNGLKIWSDIIIKLNTEICNIKEKNKL